MTSKRAIPDTGSQKSFPNNPVRTSPGLFFCPDSGLTTEDRHTCRSLTIPRDRSIHPPSSLCSTPWSISPHTEIPQKKRFPEIVNSVNKIACVPSWRTQHYAGRLRRSSRGRRSPRFPPVADAGFIPLRDLPTSDTQIRVNTSGAPSLQRIPWLSATWMRNTSGPRTHSFPQFQAEI